MRLLALHVLNEQYGEGTHPMKVPQNEHVHVLWSLEKDLCINIHYASEYSTTAINKTLQTHQNNLVAQAYKRQVSQNRKI